MSHRHFSFLHAWLPVFVCKKMIKAKSLLRMHKPPHWMRHFFAINADFKHPIKFLAQFLPLLLLDIHKKKWLTVLSDAASTEFLNTSLTRNSPPSFISHKSDLLESTITSRSYQDTPYCPNSWTTPYHPTTCNNNYYNNTAYNSQHFNTPSPAVVYPAIISTVNQNQIHFHLHPTPSDVSRNEYFLPDSISSEVPRVDLVPTTVREVTTEHGVSSSSMQESSREENAVQDPSNVWRPY